ncbi:MAG: Crp/Fnr family transcriptional regulator [Magnetococcales bacterium]|nr:Crp/Fnr family transcriptional regulator [Magnetococcales bacterium]
MEAWRGLSPEDQRAVCLFAEFLRSKGQRAEPRSVPREPLSIPAPAGESAVAALKRLKATYPMIEADTGLLEEASRLLMDKVLGKPDKEVISGMEALFQRRYRAWLEAERTRSAPE